jgi:hypothetical protein
MNHLKLALILIALAFSIPASVLAGSGVVVNGQPISKAAVHALEEVYRTNVPDGRYWYDPVSGLWGLEGGPGIGQIAPAMNLGGRLSAHASGSQTGVFVNGREIHHSELAFLQRLYGGVRRGRYWLNHRGIAGFEGGPARFDLRAAVAKASGYNRGTAGGSLMSDGDCYGYLHPDGASVLGGNC